MKSFYTYILIFIFTGLFKSMLAQQANDSSQESPGIKILSKAYGDSIRVRWAPESQFVMDQILEYGVNVWRYTSAINGTRITTTDRLSTRKKIAAGVRPLSLQQWMPFAENNDSDAMAAGFLYDEDMVQKSAWQGSDVGSLIEANEAAQWRFAIGLLAADQSFSTACRMALGITDIDVIQGHSYVYTVELNNAPPSLQIPASIHRVDNIPNTGLPPMSKLTANWENEKVRLTWSDKELKNQYIGYHLEKSSDGVSFDRINTALIMNLGSSDSDPVVSYSDSLDDNSTKYYYRVQGQSLFGELGEYSNVVVGVGEHGPAVISSPQIMSYEELEDGKIWLTWDFHPNFESEILGFEIYRSDKETGEAVRLNTGYYPPHSRVFIDEDQDGRAYYYSIVAIDKWGYPHGSIPLYVSLRDVIPPEVPEGFQGEFDSLTTSFRLAWASNSEEDLKGYLVYVSNFPENGFIPIPGGDVQDTIYIYTPELTDNSENYYFQLRAYDYRSNLSDPTSTLLVKRPDNLAPSPPIFKRVSSRNGAVFLEWANSSSPDVVKTVLRKRPFDKAEGDAMWTDIYENHRVGGKDSHLDEGVSKSLKYDYQLISFDDAGNRSSSDIVRANPYDDGFSGESEKAKASYISDEKCIKLDWTIQSEKQIDKVVIYRGLDGEAPMRYEFIETSDPNLEYVLRDSYHNFVWRDFNMGWSQLYEYRLFAYFQDGTKTRWITFDKTRVE